MAYAEFAVPISRMEMETYTSRQDALVLALKMLEHSRLGFTIYHRKSSKAKFSEYGYVRWYDGQPVLDITDYMGYTNRFLIQSDGKIKHIDGGI